jgi:anti-anti-sigma factor
MSLADTDLRVSVRLDDVDRVVYRLTGEIDASNADVLPLAVLSIDPLPGLLVIIDFTDVTFIDSSGLAALLECRASLAKYGAALEVRNAGAQALKLFTITGLTELLG